MQPKLPAPAVKARQPAVTATPATVETMVLALSSIQPPMAPQKLSSSFSSSLGLGGVILRFCSSLRRFS
ncbi:hypothetical protein [Acrocarpospora catenulata]|uniref:hypothetical protein n=1 Tax=Acrocarpospora catenulata TaxID=2836182 RepID=UPI001BDA022B|nr:hypothetical protein [Acrocarpospora catenulata]